MKTFAARFSSLDAAFRELERFWRSGGPRIIERYRCSAFKCSPVRSSPQKSYVSY